MGLWEDIRAALATKANTDVAALRQGTLGRPTGLGGRPAVFVGIPSGAFSETPGANVDPYILTYPGELVVDVPAGEQRADASASDLVRLLFTSWRTGIQLGLGSSGVVGSWLSSWAPAYETPAGGGPDLVTGYDLVWSVRLLETFNPGRTA